MRLILRYVTCLAALIGGVVSVAASAQASPFTLDDNYYGGTDTWNYPSDVIGEQDIFGIDSAVIQRIDGGNTLEVTINTNFAGMPGAPGTYGIGYGALFITPGANAWTPQGSGPNYTTDTYQAGDWAYAATIPMDPGSTTSAPGAFYSTGDGTIVMSNVYGNETTYPYRGNNGYYFRQGQAVQFNPSGSPVPNTSESWSIDAAANTITFYIADYGLLGDQFALSWAMTCGNDIIQGQVSLDPTDPTPVPEPATFSLMAAGIAFAGALRMRRSRKMH